MKVKQIITEEWDRKQLEEERLKLARLIYQPSNSILMQPNGIFELYNLQESEAERVINILRMNNIECSKSRGQIDFSHISPLGQPKYKYNITGRIEII